MTACTDDKLAAEIKSAALALGYDKCGLIKIAEVADYTARLEQRSADFPADRPFLEHFKSLGRPEEKFPWAKSILVTVWDLGVYKVPEHLLGHIGKYFTVDGRRDPQAPVHQASLELGEFMAVRGLRAETERDYGYIALRLAAERAGLGRIRRNNFFYTEKGSCVWIEAWLIDRELELKGSAQLKACPDKCDKCLRACPTGSLCGPFKMSPTNCAAFRAFNPAGGDWSRDPLGPKMDGWLLGCDACQDACPFNAQAWRPEKDFPGLEELSERISLAKLVEADYDFLRQVLSPKFWYIDPDQVWRWKANALNAMVNDYRPEYERSINKARDDEDERVRALAVWAAERTSTPDKAAFG